jgi:hypothetical protein
MPAASDNAVSLPSTLQGPEASMRFPWKYATSFILVAASALCLAAPTHAGDAPSLERMKKEYRRPAAIPFPDDNPFSVDKQRLGQQLFFDPRLILLANHFRRIVEEQTGKWLPV